MKRMPLRLVFPSGMDAVRARAALAQSGKAARQETGRAASMPLHGGGDRRISEDPPCGPQNSGQIRKAAEVMTKYTKNTRSSHPMISLNSSLATASMAMAQKGWIMSVIMSPQA